MKLSPHRFIRALLRQPVDRTPVWLMRQAGRYLPEYRALRAEAGDFMALCQTPELACEVTLQPLARFPLDAAILFSDILTIPDAMGLGLHFVTNEGPRFHSPLRTASDIQKLEVPDPSVKLKYVLDTIGLVKKSLSNRLPLIGFSGSPWTLATYMVEGKSSDTFAQAKKLLYTDPVLMHQLLDKLAHAVSDYLNAQIASGVDAVMIFDTWGGCLTKADYKAFSLYYMAKVISQLQRERNHQKIPCIVFTKHGGAWLNEMRNIGCDAIGLDWMTDITVARETVGDKMALQGNLDPAVLYTNPECIAREVGKILASYGQHSGHVFNLGHGVPQDVPIENVAALVEAVHRLSQPYHD